MNAQVLVNQMYIMDSLMGLLHSDLDEEQKKHLTEHLRDAREFTHNFLLGEGKSDLKCIFGVDGTLFIDNVDNLKDIKRVIIMDKMFCKEFYQDGSSEEE